jgi:hypothetical protein
VGTPHSFGRVVELTGSQGNVNGSRLVLVAQTSELCPTIVSLDTASTSRWPVSVTFSGMTSPGAAGVNGLLALPRMRWTFSGA